MKNRTLALLSALAFSALTQTAQAGMINDTVHLDYLFPDVGSVYNDFGNQTVGANGVTYSLYEWLDLTVRDRQVVVDFKAVGYFYGADFSGFRLTDFSKALPSFSLNGASNMPGFSAGNFYVSGNALYVNWAGLSFTDTTHVVLDAPADVPEPLTVGLMGLGLLALGAARRRG